MKKMSISSLDLDNNLYITAYTKNLTKMTSIIEEDLTKTPFAEIINVKSEELNTLFNSLDYNQMTPLLIFNNAHRQSTKREPKMFIFYLLIKKHTNGYLVYFVNWISYIHNIRESLNINYLNFSNINDKFSRVSKTFDTLSTVDIFKALYPLILHTPNDRTNRLPNGVNLWELTRGFLNNSKLTKDYAGNTFSRLRTAIKNEYNYPAPNVYEFISPDKHSDHNNSNEMYVSKTTLKYSLIFRIKPDELLNYLILNVNHTSQ